MILEQICGKGAASQETELCLAAKVAFKRIPCPNKQQRGGSQTSPGWLSHTKLVPHTDFKEVQEWLPSFPDFRTRTQGSRMRLQENYPLQHLNSIAIGQPAEGGRWARGLELRGAVSPTCLQASAGFSALR